VRIKIWGARGSIPTPSTAEFVTSRYGGNTTCVSVHGAGQTVIFDAGSGLRNLGIELARLGPLQATFFFSHLHWDHIQGFPFFVPCFVKGNAFDLYGAVHDGAALPSAGALQEALTMQQRSLNFPVQLADLPIALRFHEMKDGVPVRLGGPAGALQITPALLNHPGRCYGFRAEEERPDGAKSAAFVFATDTEHVEGLGAGIQRLAKDAAILFYDSQYTEEEYQGQGGMSHKGWGHSTWRNGLREARAAGVKRLILTHHDPLHDDWQIARIENEARRAGVKIGLAVDAAHEGMELEL